MPIYLIVSNVVHQYELSLWIFTNRCIQLNFSLAEMCDSHKCALQKVFKSGREPEPGESKKGQQLCWPFVV